MGRRHQPEPVVPVPVGRVVVVAVRRAGVIMVVVPRPAPQHPRLLPGGLAAPPPGTPRAPPRGGGGAPPPCGRAGGPKPHPTGSRCAARRPTHPAATRLRLAISLQFRLVAPPGAGASTTRRTPPR